MKNDSVEERYFNWLYDNICSKRAHDDVSYYKILNLLYNRDFYYTIKMDANRGVDGIGLRYRFDMETNPDTLLATNTIIHTCSILEMMYALAIKIEYEYMDDPRYGDRTAQWFWEMMKNLGLSMMTDDNYDEQAANEIIDKFLNRDYDHDGKGNIFYVRNSYEDQRDLEIWVQAECYLANII